MPPGPPQLQDDEGGGIGAVHGPFHLGERPTLHCEALGGVMQKIFITFVAIPENHSLF